MIVGDPAMLAIEFCITQAYSALSLRAIGYFVVHVHGRRYGVYRPDATLLACSFDSVKERIARRGVHAAFFGEERAGNVADAFLEAFYAENQAEFYFGVPAHEFRELIKSKDIVWAPDGDEAFDDGSYILQFDVNNHVRIIAFKMREGYRHDPVTLSDLWLGADSFYSLLRHWSHVFETEWATTPKVA